MTTSNKSRFIINVAFIAVILALAFFCIKYLLVWLLPFLIAFLIAMLLQRPINWILLHTKLHRKTIAPIVTFLIVALVMFLLGLLIVKAVTELAAFFMTLPNWFSQSAPSLMDAINNRFEGIIASLPGQWESQIRLITADAVEYIQGQLASLSTIVVKWVAGVATSVPSVLVAFIVTLVSTFFISADFNKVKYFIKKQIPDRYNDMAGDAFKTFGATLKRMVQSYLLIMLITFVELSIGLTVLRIDYSIIVAALISLVDLLPVLGTGTILIPWGIASLIVGDLWLGVGILLIYVILTIVRNIVEPRIVGNRIGLHPLVTLIFMYLGLRVMGIIGMFLFPMMFILVKNAQETGVVKLWK